MRFLTLACVVAGARAHTESIAAIDAGKDTITLAAADPGTLVGTEVALIDATASTTCASAVGAASPLVVTGVDGAVLSFAAGSIVNSDVDAATNCKLSRDVSPVPGTVAGEKIFFTNVDEKSFKVSWATPANLGDYSADIVGYDIQIASVCELKEVEELVYANKVGTHIPANFDASIKNVAMTAVAQGDAYAEGIFTGLVDGSTDQHGVSGSATATGTELLDDGIREISAWGTFASTTTRELGPWAQTRKVSYLEHVTIPGASTGTGTIATALASYDSTTSHSLFETASNGNVGWAEDSLAASPMLDCTTWVPTTGGYTERAGASACVVAGDDDTSEIPIGTASGKTLARVLPSDGSTSACDAATVWEASEPVDATAGTARTTWVPVTGVYTPKGGQDFSKQCIDACQTGTCGAGDLTDPVEQCGACYPRDAIAEADLSDSASVTGCFPGATDFPTEPDTSHTINLPGASAGSYYVIRVRAYNAFGQGPYGTQSYAVQLATAPTEPLELAMGDSAAADDSYSASPSGVTLTWSAPDNFATGTDDCAGSNAAAAASVEELRCSARSTADIAKECGMINCETCISDDPGDTNHVAQCAAIVLDGVAATCTNRGCEHTPGTNCNAIAADCLDGDYYDCSYNDATEVISPFACTTNGYGAGTVGEAKCSAATDSIAACTGISSPSSQAACAAGGMHCMINAARTECTVSQAFCDAQATGCTYSGGACVPTKFYTVYQDGVEIATDISASTYAVTDLTPDTTYNFRVSMTNVVGEGPKSEALAVKTPGVPGIPVAPRVVSVESIADGAGSSIELDWTAALQAVGTKTTITGYRLWAQSKDGFTFATAEDCTAIDPTISANVDVCNGVTLNGVAATCTDAGDGSKCKHTPARAAGSATWRPAARVYDFDADMSRAPVGDIVEDEIASVAPGDAGSEAALEINTVSDAESAISGATYTDVVPGATVTNLRTATEYRFAIQFTNAAGDGPVSVFSSSVTTLEEPVSDLRIMSGPPCVFEVPAATTFAAASAGTNVRYSWELVYNGDKGNGALNNDDTAGANNFNANTGADLPTGVCVATDATLCADMVDEAICTSTGDRGGINPGVCDWVDGACVATAAPFCADASITTQAECEAAVDGFSDPVRCTFHNALSAGDTPGVMSGSIIAGCKLGDGSAGDCTANCKNAACSVMEYTIPLPGFDDAVPDYDEMEIRVMAYNTRGTVRESVAFGWTPRTGDGDDHANDYQTIEYCGCTEPSATNYWQLATFSLPATCDGVEMWDATHTAAGHMLSTVLKNEFEYYQFHYDHTATEVEVTVRLDSGTVDVYVGSEGVATPGATSTYTTSQTGISSYFVKTIPYWQLQGSSSLYITVKGAADGGAFAHYKVMAKANTFRSFSCDSAAADPHCTGGEDGTGTGETTIYRAVLTEGTMVSGKVVPTYYYHFYEFAYPSAPNDIDVELQVGCSVGEVEVFASKKERYPSDQRAVDSNLDGQITAADSPGYWPGTSHTGSVADGNTTNFMYTLKPQAHHDTVSSGHGGLLFFSVKGIASHSAGEFLPSSTYSIKAKVYRYRVQSELLDPIGGLAEERRYSVVTLDNFNYYEVRLTPSTSSVTINLQVHYGEASLYRSKSTLPTQDSSAAADGGGADAVWDLSGPDWGTAPSNIGSAAGALTMTINSDGLNLVDGYVYFGLIGRTAECSYDLSVTLTELNSGTSPTALYNCGGGIVSTSASCLDSNGDALIASSLGTAALTQDVTYFYKFHISEYENVDMYVTERSGRGTPVARDALNTPQDTWGADWTETSVSTWVDDFSDELNLDVDVAITAPSDAVVYVSASDPYPSLDRLTPDVFDLDDATSLIGTFENVGTFSRTWLYLSIKPVNADLTTAAIRISPTENVPTSATVETTAASACEAADDPCNDHGSCIVDTYGEDASGIARCICDDGWFNGPDGFCSVSAATSGGSVEMDATFSVNGGDVCVDRSVQCTIDEIVPTVSSTPDATGKVSTLYESLTEEVDLDCRVDRCQPTGTAGQAGYVSCSSANTECTILVPQPMMTVSMSVSAAPAYSKIRAYMNGKPYPRAGANTFVKADPGDYITNLKVYSLPPSTKEHTLNLVLTTDNGDPLAISTRSFVVDYQGGCGVGGTCNGQGVCHSGYCVCFDGYYGSSCENDVADVTQSVDTVSTFGASTAYRLRQDALIAEKLASTRFVHKIHLEETQTELAREQNTRAAKNAATTNKLEDDILTLDSTLNEALAASKSTVDSSVSSVFSKLERNTIRIQQAKQEAARLKTANREAYIDQKRALYAHATAVQNANDAALLIAQQKIAAHNQAIEDNFREGRFIKNQLRTANGPRTAVSDLKTQSCTTDQFFNTRCTDVDYDDADFAAGARTDTIRDEAARVDAAIAEERGGSSVPR